MVRGVKQIVTAAAWPCWLAGAAPASAAPASSPIYSVVRIGSAISDDQIVGTRRAGLMCLPNGVIRWNDIATGSSMDQREIVQDTIEDADIPVTPLGEYAAGMDRRALRLRGTIRSAQFALCARHWAIGDAKALSGDATLEIEWRAESRAEAAVERKHLTRIVRRIDGSHAVPMGAIYRTMLSEAAKDLARWLSDPDAQAR